MSTQLDPLSLAGDLLYAVETAGETEPLRDRLAAIEQSVLERRLGGRRQKLAFWLNCYNAYTQLLLEDEPSLLSGGALERRAFCRREAVPIAGTTLSLDDIEHGLLRASKYAWGMGYVPRLFVSSFERQFRLESVDPRIHFALTYGKEGDPPMTVYSPVGIDADLDNTAEWFLETNVTYDRRRDTVTLPRLFLWYRGDFGGKRGILRFLERYEVIPAGETPSFRYHSDEWGLEVTQ